MKRTLSLFLSLILIMTALSTLELTAFADGYPKAKDIYVSTKEGTNVYLSSDKPCYVNNATAPTADAEGANLVYDEATGVMTINNYDGGGIDLRYASGDLTLVLNGTNNISGHQFCVYCEYGNLTVTSKSGGVLNMSNDTDNCGGLVNYWAVSNDYNLTISGNAKINYNTKHDGQISAIRSKNKINILDDAGISVKAESQAQYNNVIGLECSELVLNTTGTIDVDLDALYYSYCTSASKIQLDNAKQIKFRATGDSPSCLVPYNDALAYLSTHPKYSNYAETDGKVYSLQLDILHVHETTLIPYKAATPVSTGNYACYYCKSCGKYFSDKEATNEIAGPKSIQKTAKWNNTITVKAKKPTVKYSSLKKKNQTLKANKLMTISKAQGKVSYTLNSAKKGKKSYKKYFKIDKKTGKLTIKKKLPKGTYKVSVKVSAPGNAYYKAGYKNTTVNIKVK